MELLCPATHTQTGDVDCLCVLHSPTEHMLSVYTQTATHTMSDLSEAPDKSSEPSSNISPCLSQNQSSHPDGVTHPSSCSDLSEGGDCTHSDQSGSLEPLILPLFATDSCLSCDFLSSQTDAEHELAFGSCSPQPSDDLLCTSETLTDPCVTESLSTSGHREDTYPFRSLSHQSDSLESDTASAPMTDLYIFESEMHDFILGPTADPQGIKSSECSPLSQTEGKEADHDCERHARIRDSLELVTKYYQSSSTDQALVDYESDVSQCMVVRPSVEDARTEDLMSVNDVRVEEEVTGVTPRAQRSDSPNELWLDACQYLTGEDCADGDVLDKIGHSVMQEGLPTSTTHSSFSPGETQESGYSPEGSDTIGWARDDSGDWGPPVERWSSVDSWATALSDWAEIISAPLEDITAAFTEIGAEIDALTQALAEVTTHTEESPGEGQSQVQTQRPMGVQDQPLEAEKIADSSIFSGQSCLSFCLGTELQDGQDPRRVQSECYSRQKQPEELQRGQRSSMGSSGVEVASSGGVEAIVSPELTPSVELGGTPANFFYFGYEEPVMIDNDVILNITEDTDLEEKDASTEMVIKEPSRDGVCEVKDEHPDLVAEQNSGKSHGPAKIPETDHQGAKPSPVLNFQSRSPLADSRVSHVDKQTCLNVNTETHVSHNTFPELDRACQVEPQWGSPKFIMPLAPLGIGSSLTRQTSSSLKGKDLICARSSPHNERELSYNRLPTLDGTTDCLSVEADEDLIHKKESTVDWAEKLCLVTDWKRSTEEIGVPSGDLSHFVPVDHIVISKEKHVACITLDLYDPFGSKAAKPSTPAVPPETTEVKTHETMPHKTHKTTSECKTRSKKDRSGSQHHHGTQVSKKQENVSHHVPTQQTCKTQENVPGETCTRQDTADGCEDKEVQLVIESGVGAEKGSSKPHGKKKKKHTQNTAVVKGVAGEPLGEVENRTMPQSAKGRIDAFEAKLGANAGKAVKDGSLSDNREKKSQKSEATEEKSLPHTEHKDQPPKNVKSPLSDDVIKRRRLSQDKFGKIVSALESKLPKADVGIQIKVETARADVGATRKKAYSEVVKQKPVIPKEDPKVVQPIQVVSVSGDPQSLCLWCQFAAVFTDYTVTWSREGTTLAETKRSAGDESRVSLTISNASHKDLGKYQCRLNSSQGSVTLHYLLTYEVLSEIVIPPTPKIISSAPAEVTTEEEDVRCSRLMFKEDFLSEQYFGENHSASIITEKVHFGEGMHRRAFRTKLQAGQIPLLLPGNQCVLKVHNAISYGTKNNDELIQKNFNLAVEECQVQNTAREYIKAYDAAAQSFEAFGEVPEIIPIYLVHRPSSDIPYATLEEELIGDFVKYSVKDGKEINLMRRDSEAGQKCCAFQHWVYHKTEGNLLVTDMQGVGMRLTDVGIATCKKGYKGFRGNCATSFIDQFKALHQCNVYCEILGLKSLQPKPKKPASAPKPKPQPSATPKKKLFGPTVKGKS